MIALSDVFEHVTQPRELLRTVQTFLKPGGLLYVKVPNARWNMLNQRGAEILRREVPYGIWDSYEHVVRPGTRGGRCGIDRSLIRRFLALISGKAGGPDPRRWTVDGGRCAAPRRDMGAEH